MSIELIEQLGKHGLVGAVAAAVLYLATKAIERGFSLTVNARPKPLDGDSTKVIVLRPDEPAKLPTGRRRKRHRSRRRRKPRWPPALRS